jgi:hypothetical protein
MTHPELTQIPGKPTAATLRTLQRQLVANAMAVHSNNGGGAHGHLSLVMTDAAYTALTGVAFVAPVHPGPAPVHAAGATQFQITETNRQFDTDVKIFHTYTQTRLKLKQQILAAVDNLYTQTLENDMFGYAQVEPLDLLDHLWDIYGAVTPDDIEKNRSRLTEPWNPDDGLEDLWQRISEIKQFATRAGEAIPDAVVVRLTKQVVEETGVFSNAIDKWQDKAPADQTWPNFITHFERENKERLRKLTAQTAGFHGAHNAGETANPAMQTPPRRPPLPATTPPPRRVPPSATAITPDVHVSTNGRKMYYCWSHGLGVNPNHTSTTCRNKKEGHNDAATADNLLGGCNIIMAAPTPRNART